MMWCTKSIGLVALMVSGLCNAGELEREESNVRMDAAQDPFETLMIDDANGPTSTLFVNCLAAGRTLEAKLYSIQIPTSAQAFITEYVRHVPDSYQLLVPADWKSITTDAVSSILECATEAYKKGYPMFKYNGVNGCKVENRIYDLKYAPACETEEREAVFILSKEQSVCPLPAVMHNMNVTSGTYTCIFVTTDLMTKSEANAWCAGKNAAVFAESKNITYSEIVQVLNGLNVGTHDFFIKAVRVGTGMWIWDTTPATFVDPALMVRNSTSADGVMYMKGSAGFKLDFGLVSSFKAGVVCV